MGYGKMEQAMKRYHLWRENLQGYPEIQKELETIAENQEEILERFNKELTFGTAGLRGKLGAGTAYMNEITVGKATQGIAEYIACKGNEAKERGVVIAHDPRHFSKEFSVLAARILAAAGIKAYLFDGLRPTPELAYAVRQLKTIAGINITASHNPKEYNGYKVYWENGAQVLSEIADGMLEKINQVDPFTGIKKMDFEEGVEAGLIHVLDDELDKKYLALVKSLALHEDNELDKEVSVVYTPLNGAGSQPVQKLLKDRGFYNVSIVEEQKDPDPDFTTVGYPNPEDPKAFALAEKLGKEKNAQVLIATDPDSDRLAIEVQKEDGSYLALNGNQTGVLLVNYVLESRKENGTLPEHGAMVKSIVTGEMSTAICESYGVKMFESLTGFKNICGRIPELQKEGYQYLFGYEESVGYALTEEVRDKDGVSAAMCICEMAAYYKKKGMTLLQVLEALYQKYGYYREEQVSLILEGIPGAERIQRMMVEFRAMDPKEFGGYAVEERIDYKDGYQDIEPSNVLKFKLKGGSWFAIRPSGTEPKLKLYIYSKEETEEKADAAVKKIKEDLLERLNRIK